MANVIRIRSLKLEKDLNNILIPVDKDEYGTNAKKINILDLKSWILSGFTGGSNTSCTGITSNVIKVIVTGTTTTTTTTSTSTTTTTVSPTVSQVYFNPIANGALAVNNSLGRVFTLQFKYEIYAFCDNAASNGANPNNATTLFELSTNGGVSWISVASVTAIVPGGDVSTQYDYSTLTGFTALINGVSTIPNIIMRGTTDCSYNISTQDGYVKVTLVYASVNSGTVSIICNDKWQKTCWLGTSTNSVLCTSSTTTTTTTTLNRIYISNYSTSVNVAYFTVDGTGINGATTPLNAGQVTSGTTTHQGELTVSISISSYTSFNNITIVDSDSNVVCQDITATGTYYFNYTAVNSNNPVYITMNNGSCSITPQYYYTAMPYNCSTCVSLGGFITISDPHNGLTLNRYYDDSLNGDKWKIIAQTGGPGSIFTDLTVDSGNIICTGICGSV